MSKAFRWSVLTLLSLSGCTLLSSGKTSQEYNRSAGAPSMTVAAHTGKYALYVGDDPITCAVQDLKRGEPLGFQYNDEGRIRAVAGTYSTTLPRDVTTARWTSVVPNEY